jgi:hypothetical protein
MEVVIRLAIKSAVIVIKGQKFMDTPEYYRGVTIVLIAGVVNLFTKITSAGVPMYPRFDNPAGIVHSLQLFSLELL